MHKPRTVAETYAYCIAKAVQRGPVCYTRRGPGVDAWTVYDQRALVAYDCSSAGVHVRSCSNDAALSHYQISRAARVLQSIGLID